MIVDDDALNKGTLFGETDQKARKRSFPYVSVSLTMLLLRFFSTLQKV